MIVAQAAAAAGVDWAQFGLAGSVIGALFALLLFFINAYRGDIKTITDKQDATIERVTLRHDTTAREISDKFAALHTKQSDDFSRLHRETLERLTRDRSD